MSTRRLATGGQIDRGRPITFTWDGKTRTGYSGDTLASALIANREEVIGRSFKYHRPRSVMSAGVEESGAIVTVGSGDRTESNVKATMQELYDGLEARGQNAWPSVRFDLGAVNNLLGRFLAAGFYYKTFMRPRFLWHTLYQKILRQFAPGGRIHWEASTHGAYDQRYAHPDVLVAAGGPSGMAAALGAADAGAAVMLVEHEAEMGGHLRWGGSDDLTDLAGLIATVVAHPGIEVLLDSTVTGRYDHNWVAVVQRSHPIAPERLIKARVGTLVVAPGLVERPYVFAGNDTPGVMLSGAARRLINLWAVKPGTRAVVLSANAQGDAAIADLFARIISEARILEGENS